MAKVNHGRIKPKAGAKPTSEDRKYWERVRALGCLKCGAPATIHHVTGYADRIGRIPRSHQLVVPLCPQHHQEVWDNASDPQSVEILNHRGFYDKHGIDLKAEAERIWVLFNA